MIKQFNFYDIYGYLLPGMLLLGLFWLPFGILTQSWPNQDISNALFFAVLAYILGHILQTIANSLVPSTAPDDKNEQRFPSDFLLDKSNLKFSEDFKSRLAKQVSAMFGLDMGAGQDGDGKIAASRNRQTAFFQARSYLLAKKLAHYVEQFEGLYAMMRGLACSFLAGAIYLAGWGLSFHRSWCRLSTVLAALLAISIGGALILSGVALSHKPNAKKAVLGLARCLLLMLFCMGFWAGQAQASGLLARAPSYAEYALWASASLALIAAGRCFSSYRAFAEMFALTVWRDFSAYLSFQSTAEISTDSDED